VCTPWLPLGLLTEWCLVMTSAPVAPAPPGQTTPRKRRLIIARTLLRAPLTATLLVVLYYVLPMDKALDTHTVLLLVLGLAVFAAILIWRTRGITQSNYPGLRAIETLAAVVPLYILAFAAETFRRPWGLW
jgi:voltage-gated potassium channel